MSLCLWARPAQSQLCRWGYARQITVGKTLAPKLPGPSEDPHSRPTPGKIPASQLRQVTVGSRVCEWQVLPGTEEGDWLGDLGARRQPGVPCQLTCSLPLWCPALGRPSWGKTLSDTSWESTHSPDHPTRAPTCLL